MGTVAGLRTRRYHGLLVVATAPPIGRHLGLAALDPVLVLGDRRVPPGHARVGRRRRRPGRPRHLATFALRRRRAALALGGRATWCSSASWRWSTAGRRSAWSTGCVRAPRPGAARARGAVHLARRPRRALRRRRPRRRQRPPTASCSRAPTGCAGRGSSPAGRGTGASAHREEAARGLNAGRGPLVRGPVRGRARARASAPRSTAWAGDLRPRPAAGGGRSSPARSRGREEVAHRAGGRGRRRRRSWPWPPTSSSSLGPTVVAGYPWFGDWSRDTMTSYEGLFLATGRADEGRAAAAAGGRVAVRGHAGQHRRRRRHGVQHRRRARCGSSTPSTATSRPPATSTWPPRWPPTLDGDRRRTTSPAPASASGVDPADGLLTQGADGLGADLDGRPGRRRPGHAAGGQAGRGQRAVDQRRWPRCGALHGAASGSDRRRPSARCEAQARPSFARRFPAAGGGLSDVVDGPGGDDRDPAAQPAPRRRPCPTPRCRRPRRSRALPARCSPRSGCARSPRPTPATSAGTGAARPSGTGLPPGHGVAVADRARTSRPCRRDRRCRRDGCSTGSRPTSREWGLGSVSETADGDAPHAATGCPFQAWSVAELIRARKLVATAAGR